MKMLLRVTRSIASMVFLASLALSDLLPFEMPSLIYDNLPEGQITFDVVDYNHEETIRTMCNATTPADGPQVIFPSDEVSARIDAKPSYTVSPLTPLLHLSTISRCRVFF